MRLVRGGVVVVEARSSTFRSRPEAVEAGIDAVRDEVLPALLEVQGCVGLSMLVDRVTGTCIVTSAWESEQLLRASAAQAAPLRARAQQVLGGRPEVRAWRVGLLHRAERTPAGAFARVTWTRLRREQMDEQREVFRAEVLPQIEQLRGFCSASLLQDRHTGRAALSVVYDTSEALIEARAVAVGLRAEALRRRPSELLAVAELEVVLAHLRVPETV